MINHKFLDVRAVRMNAEPIYQILDEIEARGENAIHHSCVTDIISEINSEVLRNHIMRVDSMMFDEGDTITDGVGYTVLKNGEWSEYKKLPLVEHCIGCKLHLSED